MTVDGDFAGLDYREQCKIVASGFTLQLNAYDLKADRWLAPSNDVNCLTLMSSSSCGENVALPYQADRRRAIAWGRLGFATVDMPASFRTGNCQLQACHLIFPNAMVETLVESSVAWDCSNLAAYIDIADRGVLRSMERLRLEALAPGPAHHGMIAALGTSIVIDLYRRFAAPRRSAAERGGRLAGWQVRRIEDHVRAHACEGHVSIATLAALCGISASHLGRSFRNGTGITLRQHVDAVRMERARCLLRDGGLPLTEVALACGYANQGHFATAFRRVQGETPSGFRQRSREAHV